MNLCSECNSELNPGNKFCANCGTAVSGKTEEETTTKRFLIKVTGRGGEYAAAFGTAS